MTAEYPLVLRAELSALPPADAVVTNTLSLSEERVWIASDALSGVGSELDVELSFPGLLDPVALRVAVDEIRESFGSRRTARRGAPLSRPERGGTAPHSCALWASRGEAASSPGNPTPRKYRVLLVEDDSMIREMFAYGVDRYFRTTQATVSVDSAGDPELAWQMLNETRAAGELLRPRDHRSTSCATSGRRRARRADAGRSRAVVDPGRCDQHGRSGRASCHARVGAPTSSSTSRFRHPRSVLDARPPRRTRGSARREYAEEGARHG